MTAAETYDVCVVGGGLVGLSVANALRERDDGLAILVLEKEPELAAHQSRHNSGVVHSGLYYRPGSLKARLCVEGREALEGLARSAGIPYRRSGKLVIATEDSQLSAIEELERRGRANGLVDLRRIGPREIAEIEPAATGKAALWVGDAGVVDFPAVARHQARLLEGAGARILRATEVVSVAHRSPGVAVTAGDQHLTSRTLVNCAGLHSDRVAVLAGLSPGVRIVPFRGEYYRLGGDSADLVRGLIYPVPDPRFPFLGVHFTRKVDGTVEVGPNATLGLGREHYPGTPIDWPELWSILAHRGFRRLARRYWRYGAAEVLHSRSARLYARLAQRLVPGVSHRDLSPGGAGVRAQAMDRQGRLIDDFVIEQAGSTIHVLNAPSPAATASIAIGRHVAGLVGALLGMPPPSDV